MNITRACREAFAGCSTGSSYYETKGSAICAFDAELARWGLQLDPYDLADFAGDTGRKMLDVCTIGDGHGEHIDCVGHAVLSWFRMESGRYEFTGYLT